MKTLIPLFLITLSLGIYSCASQQETTEEDIRIQKFMTGHTGQKQSNAAAASIRGADPNDMRYAVTMQPPAPFMPRHAAQTMGRMSQYPYSQAEANWKPMHELAKAAIQDAQKTLSNKAERMTNVEMISFFMLDKYLSKVAISPDLVAAVDFYLQTLVEEGSKAELYVATSSLGKVYQQLDAAKAAHYQTYYDNVISTVLKDQSADKLAKSWAAIALEQLPRQ